jgi:type IV pilus assembly protein PilM
MGETALGIDVGSHAIKAVLLRRKGNRIQVVRAGSARLEELGHMEDSRRKITKEGMILRNLLKSIGVRPRPAVIGVGGRKSIIRYTRVPPAPAWRLKMLVEYEIEGDTGGQEQGLAYDFRLLDLPTSHIEFTVMIAMARNELVDNHCEILEDAGVKVEDVTLSPFALFNTYLQNRGPVIEDDKTVLLVDIGAENLNVVVQRNGRLFFARNITPGARAFTEAVQDEFRVPFAEAEELKCSQGRLLMGRETHSDDETQVSPSADAPTEVSGAEDLTLHGDEDIGPALSLTGPDPTAQLSEAMIPVVGRLASAIQSSLMYCRAQTRMTDLEVDEMVITGAGSKLPGLRHELGRRLGIPVAPADPLKHLDLRPMNRTARDELEGNAETYATAIGLALGRLHPDAAQFSLLPARIKERRRFFAKTLYLWLAGAAMLAGMGVLAYSSVHHTAQLEGHVQQTEQLLSDNEKEKAKLDQLQMVNTEYKAEIELMRRYFASPRQMMRALGALMSCVPPEVEIAKFSAAPPQKGSGTEVVIEGVVLKKIKQRTGPDRTLQRGDAHEIIGKLKDDLTAHEAFRPPGENRSVIESEILKPGVNSVASFKLRLQLTDVKDDKTVGRE